MTNVILEDIIRIKSVAWPYDVEKQTAWINNNISENDLHVILRKKEENVAYLNLIDITLGVNDKEHKGYGIGNVCAIEKGKGYGLKLMLQVNKLLKDEQRIGLLFCKPALVKFYESAEWQLIDKCKVFVRLEDSDIMTMAYNLQKDTSKLIYGEKIF